MVRAYIGVGASIEPEPNILAAIEALARTTRVVGISTFYRTPALARPGDPDFVNGVVAVETALEPGRLKHVVLRSLEHRAGRRRTGDRWGPRPLDLDLLLHGQAVVRAPGLLLPDPSIRTRRFVAAPLHELAPELVLPDTGQALTELLGRVPAGPMTSMPRMTARLRERVKEATPAPFMSDI